MRILKYNSIEIIIENMYILYILYILQSSEIQILSNSIIDLESFSIQCGFLCQISL